MSLNESEELFVEKVEMMKGEDDVTDWNKETQDETMDFDQNAPE